MKKNSLLDIFEVRKKQESQIIIHDEKLSKELKIKIISDLINKDIPNDKIEFINSEIDTIIKQYNLNDLERNHVHKVIENEVNGYGPLTELMMDKSVTEIMVNAPDEIYIGTDGKIIKDESVSFINNEHIIKTVQRIIKPFGKTIDTSNSIIDLRLGDGSRINAITSPLSLKGPVFTIKKPSELLDNIEDLLRMGTMTPYMARFLEACIHAKLNIIICGSSGSGKTTLLNTLCSFIDKNERIITIEEEPELKLNQSNVVSLETYKDKITIRDLVINSLQMKPDRIIIDEVNGKEVFNILQAMNNGYNGSLFTMYANNSLDCLNRLETMILMANLEMPINVIHEYITNVIDLVINIEKISDDRRKVISISELSKTKDGNIILKDIFAFKKIDSKQANGEFVRYDFIPKILNKIKAKGITDIDYIFKN